MRYGSATGASVPPPAPAQPPDISMPSVAVRMRPRVLFVRHFLSSPRSVGSAIPSSRRLTQQLIAGINWEKARVIVEYGPGTGVVTRAILARMAPDARLLAFEINTDFIAYLRRECPDPRLILVAASAETIEAVLASHGLAGVDAAISSLPFSVMPGHVRQAILTATARVLRPDAPFVGYQYSRRWLGELRLAFGAVAVQFEPRNWPPAFVFSARAAA